MVLDSVKKMQLSDNLHCLCTHTSNAPDILCPPFFFGVFVFRYVFLFA